MCAYRIYGTSITDPFRVVLTLLLENVAQKQGSSRASLKQVEYLSLHFQSNRHLDLKFRNHI
jgi:hypothetical protein